MISVLFNLISIIATFTLVLGILYLIQKFTIGLLPFFKKNIYKTFALGDPIFILVSLIFVFKYVEFYKPY